MIVCSRDRHGVVPVMAGEPGGVDNGLSLGVALNDPPLDMERGLGWGEGVGEVLDKLFFLLQITNKQINKIILITKLTISIALVSFRNTFNFLYSGCHIL